MADASLSDRLVVEIGADLSSLTQGLSQAGRDVGQFANGTVGQATRSMNAAFDGTFRAFENSVVKAARTGTLSVRQMVNAIIADLARVAIQKSIVWPLENAVQDIVGSVIGSVSGRAAGGPVSPGTPYIVGERGPELFVPSGGGDIVPGAARARASVVVNVTTNDAQSFLKSESQVAAMLSRALARGQRNL